MKKIIINTTVKRLLADVYTPVGIYLRLRDRFRDTILLESTDSHAAENSYSFIGVNAIGGIEISNTQQAEFKLPGQNPEQVTLQQTGVVPQLIWDFMNRFDIVQTDAKEAVFAQGLYGYSTYDAVQFFDTISFLKKEDKSNQVPLMRYRLYQYVIAFNHFKDELFILENQVNGIKSELALIENLIRGKDVPVYPFTVSGTETSNITDDTYRDMVSKGIQACQRGDVFQIVLSRRFQQGFKGDEFNVYRALGSINLSP